MANHMSTHIIVRNGDDKVLEKLREIFTPNEGEYQVDTEDLGKRIFGEDAPEEYDRGWYCDNLGAKWVYSEYDDSDDTDYINLMLTSAWSVPQGLLEKLAEVLSNVKEDCYICGTYEDESYDPIGVFLYAKDYDDIEDYYESIDTSKMWEDDEYRESIWDKVTSCRDDFEKSYIEHLKDLEDEKTNL